ncbi:hypothetical protein ABFA07_012458 [Porites harrisoni]
MTTSTTARPKFGQPIKKGGDSIRVLEKLLGLKKLDTGAVPTMQTQTTLSSLGENNFEPSYQSNQAKRRVRRQRCSPSNPRCYRPTRSANHKRVHKHMRMRKRQGRQH